MSLEQINDECSICFDSIQESEISETPTSPFLLRCSHAYHRECIQNYLRIYESVRFCPYCRGTISIIDYFLLGRRTDFRHDIHGTSLEVRNMFSGGKSIEHVANQLMLRWIPHPSRLNFDQFMPNDEETSSSAGAVNWARNVFTKLQSMLLDVSQQVQQLSGEVLVLTNGLRVEKALFDQGQVQNYQGVSAGVSQLVNLYDKVSDIGNLFMETMEAAVVFCELVRVHRAEFSELDDLQISLSALLSGMHEQRMAQLNIVLKMCEDCREFLMMNRKDGGAVQQ